MMVLSVLVGRAILGDISMTIRLSIPLLAALAAACGGKSSGDTSPPAGDGHATHDHAGDTGDNGTITGGEPDQTPSTGDAHKTKADLLAAETTAYEQARPVLDTYCAKCHAKGGKNARPKSLEHFDMSSYPFGGHHAVEIGTEVRKVLGIGGGKPTMPFDHPGAVKGDELALIAAWADAYDKAHEGGAHADRGHGDGDHHHGGDHHH